VNKTGTEVLFHTGSGRMASAATVKLLELRRTNDAEDEDKKVDFQACQTHGNREVRVSEAWCTPSDDRKERKEKTPDA
jgi:hypothetical protein